MIWHKVLASGSKGNAVALGWGGAPYILIDCGAPQRAVAPYIKTLRLALMTHAHSDHFNRRTVAWLARERPALRFVSEPWLHGELRACGIPSFMLDQLAPDTSAAYAGMEPGVKLAVSMVPARHDVPNCGYKIELPSGGRVFYMTDTSDMAGITAKNFDLYMLEGNYSESDMPARIKDKIAKGGYQYEQRAMGNHLSVEQALDWIYQNAGPKSEYLLLHQHEPG